MPMKIYLAARFSKRHILQEWAEQLEADGHQIVSRWSKRGSDHKIPPGQSEEAAFRERRRFAEEDLEDLDQADCVLSLMEEPRSNGRGGRHVEFGYALATGCRMVIVGPRETVFHCLREVEAFETFEQARAAMATKASALADEATDCRAPLAPAESLRDLLRKAAAVNAEDEARLNSVESIESATETQ
jgi:Nucleoside 2-deoxyribosyltransferase